MRPNPSLTLWNRTRSVAVGAALLWLAAASHARAQKDDFSDADQKALAGYHLTLERLDKFDATNKKIAAASATDPALAKELAVSSALNTGTTLDDALGQFDARAPHLAAVIKGAGMTDREYVLSLFSVMFAESGRMLKQYAPDKPLPVYIPADNVAFTEKNRVRFQEVVANLGHLSAKPKKHPSEDETTTDD